MYAARKSLMLHGKHSCWLLLHGNHSCCTEFLLIVIHITTHTNHHPPPITHSPPPTTTHHPPITTHHPPTNYHTEIFSVGATEVIKDVREVRFIVLYACHGYNWLQYMKRRLKDAMGLSYLHNQLAKSIRITISSEPKISIRKYSFSSLLRVINF